MKTIWTIGHSTRDLDDFIHLLKTFEIELLIDVRHYPGSRKFPHFNKQNLMEYLPKHGIEYNHIVELGGRRKVQPDSQNNAWRNASFQGYADHMETNSFKDAFEQLQAIASQNRTALMCSEAVWWRCHRSMIADALKVNDWTVLHIMNDKKAPEHPYTAPAKVVDGKLDYSKSH